MNYSARVGVYFIAMNNYHAVQLFKVCLEPGRHASSSMALQRCKSKPIGLVMRYYIVDVAVAEIAHAIKQDNILAII